MKNKKRSGFDDISINVLKKMLGIIKNPLINFFNFSLNKDVFPAGFSLIFKNGEKYELTTNHNLVSVLAFISQILKRIMYNILHHCFDEISPVFKNKSFTNGIMIIWY